MSDVDDVLLDTLARTLAEHIYQSPNPYAAQCPCGWVGGTDEFTRHLAEEVLAVMGEDGVPLLQIRGRDGV